MRTTEYKHFETGRNIEMDNFSNENDAMNQNGMQNGSQYSEQPYGQPMYNGEPPKNKFVSHLVLSIIEIIFSTVCGIISLIFTIQGNSAYEARDYEKAAKKYKASNITLIIGLILSIIVIGVMTAVGVTAYMYATDTTDDAYLYDDTTSDLIDDTDETEEEDTDSEYSFIDAPDIAAAIEASGTENGYSVYDVASSELSSVQDYVLGEGADDYTVLADESGNNIQAIIGDADTIEYFADSFITEYGMTDGGNGLYTGDYAGSYISMYQADNYILFNMAIADDDATRTSFDESVNAVISGINY